MCVYTHTHTNMQTVCKQQAVKLDPSRVTFAQNPVILLYLFSRHGSLASHISSQLLCNPLLINKCTLPIGGVRQTLLHSETFRWHRRKKRRVASLIQNELKISKVPASHILGYAVSSSIHEYATADSVLIFN